MEYKTDGFKRCMKKPIAIHAKQMETEFVVTTLENQGFKGKAGDYWMIGVNGEHYVCDKEIFEKTYDWVDEKEIIEQPEKIKLERDKLIMAVGNKYPNESRFETALRMIQQSQNHLDDEKEAQ